MKEPYTEGLTTHGVPESCVVDRKGGGEALTRACTGTVLSREIKQLQGADAVFGSGRPHQRYRYREMPLGPARSKTRRTCRTSLRENREILCPPFGRWCRGTHREGRRLDADDERT